MSIEELGALGEFLGFFAVLITLIYLAVQTKQAKEVATLQATRNIVIDFQHIWSTLGENRENTRLFRIAVNDWNALPLNEQMIVHSFFVKLILHLNVVLEQIDRLPELRNFVRGWENNILGLLQCPGGRTWYEQCEYVFLSNVRERISTRLADPDSLPPAWTETMPWWNIEETESSERGRPHVEPIVGS